MRFFISFAFISSIGAFATPSVPQWHPPGIGDVRSPCPGINVLANHGILPHNGRNLDREKIRNALGTWYNIDQQVADNLVDRALDLTGRPNATTFDMVDIRVHSSPLRPAIEMDASFSRADAYWGDAYSLNRTVWDQTRSYWKGPTIDVQEFGKAAKARYLTSQATNPNFRFDDSTMIGFAMSFMTGVLGDAEAGTVPTSFVDSWIVDERLPVNFGWQTSKKAVTGTTIGALGIKIFLASGLPNTTAEHTKRSNPAEFGVHF